MRTSEQSLAPGIVMQAFPDPEALSGELADLVAGTLRQAIRKRGRALLVVSGGRSPAGFLRRLSTLSVDWRSVDVLPADERWAPADSDQRNSRLIRQTLLQGLAAAASFHELVTEGTGTPAQAAVQACLRLDDLSWPADVVVLGMGEDGHTASLFPDAPELPQGLMPGAPRVVAMTPASQVTARLSLSAEALAGASLTVLLLQGEGKRAALELALAAPAAITERPIRYFFSQPLQVFWSP